jgi:hypothetical protein
MKRCTLVPIYAKMASKRAYSKPFRPIVQVRQNPTALDRAKRQIRATPANDAKKRTRPPRSRHARNRRGSTL